MDENDGVATAVDRIETHLDRIESILNEIRGLAHELQEKGDADGRTEGEAR